MANRWDKQSDMALLQGIGAYGLSWFQARSGRSYDHANAPPQRSIAALYGRARRLFGPGGFTRGTYTLHGASISTGYTREQLRRAASALNQKWKRLRRRGAYIITEEQLEDICEWLKHDYWCKPLQLYACVWCGTSATSPAGMGLCSRCYHRYRRRAVSLGLPATRREMRRLVDDLKKNENSTSVFMLRIHAWISQGRAPTEGDLEQLARLAGTTTYH
jgi:hypothetical protein